MSGSEDIARVTGDFGVVEEAEGDGDLPSEFWAGASAGEGDELYRPQDGDGPAEGVSLGVAAAVDSAFRIHSVLADVDYSGGDWDFRVR